MLTEKEVRQFLKAIDEEILRLDNKSLKLRLWTAHKTIKIILGEDKNEQRFL